EEEKCAIEVVLFAEAADRDFTLDGRAAFAFEILAVKLGDDPPRRDRIDADALEAELERERLGELDHARLGGGIADDALVHAVAEHRRNVDDRAAFAGREQAPRRLLR